ncbi:MAG TPA: hypothetical protein VFO46_04890 [Candidatus Sulfotelmatobacter sp.]|nr:hypothetical protein [Candidatus Sulfotelmatobacter sp.]
MTKAGKHVRQISRRFLCLLLGVVLCGQTALSQSGLKARKIVLVRFELHVNCSDLKNCELLHSLGVDDSYQLNLLLSTFTEQVLRAAQMAAAKESRVLDIAEEDTDFNTAKANLAKSWHRPGPSPDWIIQAVITPLGPGDGYNISLKSQRATDGKTYWHYLHPCHSGASRLPDVVNGDYPKVGSELATLGKNILDSSQSDGQ